jgi:hypothetical protein
LRAAAKAGSARQRLAIPHKSIIVPAYSRPRLGGEKQNMRIGKAAWARRRSRASVPLLLAAASLLLPAAAAGRRGPIRDVRPPIARQVIITADDRCPRPRGDDIFVCGIRRMTRTDLRALHKFSRCVAERRPAEARAILAAGYDGNESGAELRRIAAQGLDCAPPGKLSVSGILFAGAMAEALVREAAGGQELAARVAPAPEQQPLAARDQAEVMSLCTVRAASAEVIALFESEAGSGKENEAVRALLPSLGACLARDVRLVTNPSGIRASLALAAWRLVLANGGASPPMEVS